MWPGRPPPPGHPGRSFHRERLRSHTCCGHLLVAWAPAEGQLAGRACCLDVAFSVGPRLRSASLSTLAWRSRPTQSTRAGCSVRSRTSSPASSQCRAPPGCGGHGTPQLPESCQAPPSLPPAQGAEARLDQRIESPSLPCQESLLLLLSVTVTLGSFKPTVCRLWGGAVAQAWACALGQATWRGCARGLWACVALARTQGRCGGECRGAHTGSPPGRPRPPPAPFSKGPARLAARPSSMTTHIWWALLLPPR